MSYDKYRTWPLTGRSGNFFTVPTDSGIEEQVLKDLASASDETEKLEILDSFAVYAQRVFRRDLALTFADAASYWTKEIINPFILSKMPEVSPPRRPRPATEAPHGKEK